MHLACYMCREPCPGLAWFGLRLASLTEMVVPYLN